MYTIALWHTKVYRKFPLPLCGEYDVSLTGHFVIVVASSASSFLLSQVPTSAANLQSQSTSTGVDSVLRIFPWTAPKSSMCGSGSGGMRRML